MSTTTDTTAAAAWVSRLERRLSKLADTASEESIQGLSKWIGFRRKYAKEFSASLAKAIADPTSLDCPPSSDKTARQWLYLQILHESIVLDSGTSRWDRLAELREVLGESCMMEVARRGCLDAATIKKLLDDGMIKQWDKLNVFGGPTLIGVIKKQLTSPEETSSKSPVRSKSPPRSPKRERSASPVPSKKKAKQESPKPEEKPKADTSTASVSVSSKAEETPKETPKTTPKKTVVYDFESKGIPIGKVDAKEFLAPCKAIATLQIARDLRNDNAVQVSSLLNALPDDVQALCEEADKEVKETGQAYELPEAKARELAVKTSERLLDMDLDEQLQNVRTFIELIEKQREARQRIIHLLIRSRCKFGANEAAEAFYELDQVQVELQKRKDTLVDAMALEGLDFEEEDANSKEKKKETELAPLTWYLNEKSGGDGEPPAAKKLKLDEK